MEPVVHAAAQQARTKPWQPNPNGARTLDDAIELAKAYGIVIEEDVRFVVRDDVLRDDEDACWGAFSSSKRYRWDDLLIRDKIVVKLRSTVLASDEAILCVLAHEMHEINAIRTMFEEAEPETISGAQLIQLTAAGFRNLHDQAWDEGDKLVHRLRSERGGDVQ